MKRHNSFLAGSLTLTLLLAATPFALAQAQPPAEDLKKDIEALKEGQKAIQKDLQEIKTLLQRQASTAGPAASERRSGPREEPVQGREQGQTHPHRVLRLPVTVLRQARP